MPDPSTGSISQIAGVLPNSSGLFAGRIAELIFVVCGLVVSACSLWQFVKRSAAGSAFLVVSSARVDR